MPGVVTGSYGAFMTSSDLDVATSRRAARATAAVGVVALACYALLKASWGLGGTIGVTDVGQWREKIDGLDGVVRWMAFWGTVVVDVVGALLLVALLAGPHRRLGRGAVRRVLRGLAWVGAVVMTLLGGYALVFSIGEELDWWSPIASGQGPLASWVFFVVYGSFVVYAVSLGATARFTRA
jgi:hypothetical protein